MVDSNDIARLTRVTQGIVNIYGTVQTAVSLGPDGQDDGLARNAGNLQLGAGVGALVGAAMGFSVAVIPKAVKFYGPVPLEALKETGRNIWAWGINWKWQAVPDNNGALALLENVDMLEEISPPHTSGYFTKDNKPGGLNVQTKPVRADIPHTDFNGLESPGQSVDDAREKLRSAILKANKPPDRNTESVTQTFKFNDSRVEVKHKEWHYVIRSGFFLQLDIEVSKDQRVITLTEGRTPADVDGVKGGIWSFDDISPDVDI